MAHGAPTGRARGSRGRIAGGARRDGPACVAHHARNRGSWSGQFGATLKRSGLPHVPGPAGRTVAAVRFHVAAPPEARRFAARGRLRGVHAGPRDRAAGGGQRDGRRV